MKLVMLERFAYTPNGVFGKIKMPEFECFTVERPWLDNKPRESCIPEGEYAMKLGRYNRGGYPAYEILNVPNRTLIKVHVGNTIDDVVGCVALGKALGYLERKWAVTSSKKAFKEFMQTMAGEKECKIKIYQYLP
ncbi:hypothetical protein HII17_17755 [Thalassotalea sp. M1531]|uniref:DUF5675 domain-containing protein n=1 Tax=Thalassotalea algicola TaxID=2716224 RepID=A0A7Y0Q8M8_9GAMM|nr:DUF5675 family protein [Thalassotalea algicola]NMP33396.1 hypothetical protein [Thalassotalea algicola]